MGAFAAFGLLSGDPSHTPHLTFCVVVGSVFLGAMTWWTGLSLVMFWLRGKLSKTWVHRLHISTDWLIILSAVLCLARGVVRSL